MCEYYTSCHIDKNCRLSVIYILKENVSLFPLQVPSSSCHEQLHTVPRGSTKPDANGSTILQLISTYAESAGSTAGVI